MLLLIVFSQRRNLESDGRQQEAMVKKQFVFSNNSNIMFFLKCLLKIIFLILLFLDDFAMPAAKQRSQNSLKSKNFRKKRTHSSLSSNSSTFPTSTHDKREISQLRREVTKIN